MTVMNTKTDVPRINPRSTHEMSKTNWTLIDEIGIEHIACTAAGPEISLSFPSYAARSADGSCLIVDELGTEKVVPFRFESRTLRLAADGRILFDTHAMGISDGTGCLLDDGSMAILCRTRWQILLISPEGQVNRRFDVAQFSKRLPRFVSPTSRQTLLVAFFNRGGEVDLVELDKRGRMLWFLPARRDPLGIFGDVQWTSDDTFLYADPLRHVAAEFDRRGRIVWQFGETGHPSQALDHLSSPGSARRLPDGRRLIADTRNHRVLLVADGTATALPIEDGGLCAPLYADISGDGNILICDTGNARVIETGPEGRIHWRAGNPGAARRTMSYPRSVEMTAPGHFLVADTARDRIVEIGRNGVRERIFAGQRPLFWPRCVRSLPSGGLLIADGRNGRVVESAADGRQVHELCRIDLDGGSQLKDPHDVRMLPDGHLLIVDSSRDLVVEADWTGKVYRVIGESGQTELKDPHSAQYLDDGSVLVADTGNHRILIVGVDGKILRQMDALQSDSGCVRLNFPRYAEVIDDGTIAIADTGHNRVLAASLTGQLLWEFSQVPGARPERLSQPRWATLLNRHEVVICDHFHHRILHVRCDGG
jgi:hypothetical protein